MGTKVDTSTEAGAAFDRWKHKIRHRHEFPEGFTQAILEQATIDNVDADLLAAICNPKHKNRRFFVRARVGAFPLDSPEEA
jgi:hypothetical protein